MPVIIPDNICIVNNDIESNITILDEDIEKTIKIKRVEIVDASKNPKINEAVSKMGRKRYYDGERKKPIVKKLIVPNEPKSGYTVLSLDYGQRSKYNISDKNGFVFQIHENSFIELIRGPGIGAGGKLSGEFVFAQTRYGICLIPFKSKIYDKLKNNNSSGKLKSKDIKRWSIYENGQGHRKLFLGRANTKKVKRDYYRRNNNYVLKNIKNGYLWVDIWGKADYNTVSAIDLLDKQLENSHSISITTSPSVYKEVHKFKDPGLTISDIREKFVQINNITSSKIARWNDSQKSRFAEYLNISSDKDFIYPGYEDYIKGLIVSSVVDA